ncbi:MAG: hypothetical protein EZS28_042544, partial [Streblomastix strix]
QQARFCYCPVCGSPVAYGVAFGNSVAYGVTLGNREILFEFILVLFKEENYPYYYILGGGVVLAQDQGTSYLQCSY